MTITVNGPNGITINFPDGTDHDTIHAAMSQATGTTPPDPKTAPDANYYNNFAKGQTGAAPTDTGDGRAFSLTPSKPAPQTPEDAQVAREAQANPIGHGINDTILSMIRGTPLGSWADEIGAGGAALANDVTGGAIGEPYDKAKAYMDARIRSLDNNSQTLGHIGPLPVTTEGLKELAGGIASAPFAPMAKIFQGASLLPRIANGIITGAGYGGLYGAGNQEGGRLNNAASGAKLGGLLGGVITPAAQASGNLFSGLSKIVGDVPAELKGFSRGAIDRIAPALQADLATTRPPLGPEGMLLDQGPSLQAHGAGLVNSNTPARSIIADALEARKAGAKGRIENDVNAALGRPVNLPAFMEQQAASAQARAKPLYDQFRAAPIKPTPELTSILERAQKAGAFQQAQKILEVEGIDPNSARNNGQFIDLIKRGIDSLTDQAIRSGDKNLARVYGNLAKELRNETDRILSPRDPSQSIWAQARKVAGDDIKNAKAVEYGQDVFKKGLSRDQMAADLKSMSRDERYHAKVGAREEVRRIMANSGTSFGDNGDSAARKLLGNDEARAKLSHVANAINASKLINRLEAESTFEKTRQPLLNNSRTALNTEARKLYPAAEKDAGAVHNITMEGMVLGPVKKIVDMLVSGAITDKNIRIATDAAKMLVAQGADRDMVVKGLRQYLANKGLSTKVQVGIKRIANVIEHGSRGVAVNSRTSPRSDAARP